MANSKSKKLSHLEMVGLLRDADQVAPEGSFSLREYCDRYKVQRTTAAEQLRKLISAGKVSFIRLNRKNQGNKYWVVKND